MKKLNSCLSTKELAMLMTLIGQNLVKIKHDEFILGKGIVFGHVELFVGNKIYAIINQNHNVDFFWGKEDICDMCFREINKNTVLVSIDNVKKISCPISQKIKDIVVINNKVTLVEKNKEQFIYEFTKKIVFVLDELEISFEKETWMSEYINVRKGKDIVDTIDYPQTGLDEWNKDQKAEFHMNKISLSKPKENKSGNKILKELEKSWKKDQT